MHGRAVIVLLLSMVATASAEPRRERIVVETPTEAFAARPISGISRTIYLERCQGGCDVRGGSVNDAENLISTIPNPGSYRLDEFRDTAGETGIAADAEWNQVVQCMKEVYSPFNVEVTDRKPAAAPYHLAIVAGSPGAVGLDPSILGVAPLANNCEAFDNVISFTFANAHDQTEVTARVLNLCWTAAQESAHAFGLDHEFEFADKRSACNDPMTYRFDCGGEKFYRNVRATCGETTGRACRCGATQNSHQKLLSVFGAGTPITEPPTVVMTTPSLGGTTLPANVVAIAKAQRGVAKLTLFLNGFPFVEVPGGVFGPNGQVEQAYGLLVPASLPDSIYDVFVRASDDLGASSDTATVTVTKNAPCTTTAACLAEQKCEAGRCQWDPPVGELGDACTFAAFCKSFLCRGTVDQQICTQTCEPDDAAGCPEGLSCNQGICFFAPDNGGCCSTSSHPLRVGLLTLLVAFVLRRRRGASRVWKNPVRRIPSGERDQFFQQPANDND